MQARKLFCTSFFATLGRATEACNAGVQTVMSFQAGSTPWPRSRPAMPMPRWGFRAPASAPVVLRRAGLTRLAAKLLTGVVVADDAVDVPVMAPLLNGMERSAPSAGDP